jgi:hypothetical protein
LYQTKELSFNQHPIKNAMKKIILLVLTLLLFLPLINAQRSAMNSVKQLNQKAKDKIVQILQNAQVIDDFTICQESFAWDTLNNEFDYDGDGLITYEDKGNFKLLTILFTTLEDEGETDVKVETYFSFQDITTVEEQGFGDSLLVYQGDGAGNYELFTKTLYFYDNEQLVLSESYIDFSLFGFPGGFAKSEVTEYRYDNNDFLVETVSDQFDFFTMELTFADSTVYDNNDKGLPLVETTYSPDFFTGELGPDFKAEFTYTAMDQLETEVNSSYMFNAFVKQNKYDYSYDAQGRRTTSIQLVTEDDGLTWEFRTRSQALYEDDLPLNLPSRQLEQDFVNGDWRNNYLTVQEDCTSGIEENNEEISFSAWFRSDWLNIATENDSKTQISLYDLSGKKLLSKDFSYLPRKIFVPGLDRGIYLVQMIQDKEIRVVKVFK